MGGLKMKDDDLKFCAPEHIFNKENSMIIRQEKSDSIEAREDAKGNVHITVKIYADFTKDDEIERVVQTIKKIQNKFKI